MKYDYSKVKYVNLKTKVIIICPEHGEFKQTPSSHLNGQGCPECYKFKPDGYWTLETCKKDALNYNTKSEWRINSSGGYGYALKHKIMDECAQHMDIIRQYWSLETCKEDAKKYKSRGEWKKKSSSYSAACRNDWLDECSLHMELKYKPKGYWTLEKCKEDALKYNTKSEWKKNSNAYGYAHRNKWLDKCCQHMNIDFQHNFWTLERCKEDALKYNTKGEWRKNSGGAYGKASKRGWMKNCTRHMIELLKPKGYWTLERCKEDALKYNTKGEWAKCGNSAYQVASRKKWLVDCCQHMK